MRADATEMTGALSWKNWIFCFFVNFFQGLYRAVQVSIKWCRAEGESAPPKVLICRKFGWNSWKFGYRGFDTFVYYWTIWLFSPKKKFFFVQRKCAHSWAWKIQLSVSGKCSTVWSWAKINEGLLVGFKSSHLSFAAPPNFHCVWLFASVNR